MMMMMMKYYFNGIVNNNEMEKMCHLEFLLMYCRKYESILFCKYVLIVCHDHLQMEITFGYSWDTRSVSCVLYVDTLPFQFLTDRNSSIFIRTDNNTSKPAIRM